MFEIDKEKFGQFITALRKEKGLTQKELADKLYISDKAVILLLMILGSLFAPVYIIGKKYE